MAKRVTIQDIADELGLSRNTVSKALNNSGGIAQTTQKRIIDKALEMGYKHFAYASSVFAHRTDISPETFAETLGDKREIALFSTTFLHGPHFASLMLDAFQNELSQLGFVLDAHRVTQRDIAQMSLPMTFKPERVAAIVCIEMFNCEYDEMLCAQGIPTLFVDAPARLDGRILPSDQLFMESTAPVTRLVNDMLENGCTNIGFIGNWKHCQSFYERYSAFRLAMLMAGRDVPEALCIRENYSDGISRCIDTLDKLPDLFICANDFVALDAIQALRSLGYDVPHDIRVAGFDDSAESRRSIPQLTTIHIHTQSMAFSAIQLLQTRLREPSLDYRHVYTETELIYRASTDKA
ncbi:MAG: LacI family DNA-binding transcriptional regulator [Atopobiaceae bacterium]|nr:LacI family DNA-binding transcriptional regulator [Atopobiaceae bacterium]